MLVSCWKGDSKEDSYNSSKRHMYGATGKVCSCGKPVWLLSSSPLVWTNVFVLFFFFHKLKWERVSIKEVETNPTSVSLLIRDGAESHKFTFLDKRGKKRGILLPSHYIMLSRSWGRRAALRELISRVVHHKKYYFVKQLYNMICERCGHLGGSQNIWASAASVLAVLTIFWLKACLLSSPTLCT